MMVIVIVIEIEIYIEIVIEIDINRWPRMIQDRLAVKIDSRSSLEGDQL